MAQLRGAGLVRSERGPGGYRLNHPHDQITLGKVVRLFQGPLAPIACATRSEPEPCPMDPLCSLKETWSEVRDATIAILERTDFATLAARAGGAWIPVDPPVRRFGGNALGRARTANTESRLRLACNPLRRF